MQKLRIMRPVRPSQGFGYSINYPKEIALDKKNLALYEDPRVVAIAQSLLPDEVAALKAGRSLDFVTWVLHKPELREARAKMIDLSLEDIYGAADAEDLLEFVPPYPESASDRRYRRGWALLKRIGETLPVMTEEFRKKCVKKHKADLARHLRNQKKFS